MSLDDAVTQATKAEITIDLGPRSYPILIGAGLLAEAGRLIATHAPARRAMVITDETVCRLHGGALEKSLAAAGLPASVITIAPGEASKSFAETERVSRAVLGAGIERGDLVVAFGGGVVGDLAGFVAGIVRRGIRVVQIPTTLLAQVDSSVGGKTGINTAEGKNLIGLFHQPSLVVADIDLLNTLAPRQLRAGYAEVVKYGLIGDAPFFEWLEGHVDALLAGDGALRVEAVRVSCAAKAAIVAADEREHGGRALLNLGHTFGHALEAATGYSDRMIHGEGVAIGMCLAFALSAELGFCKPAVATRVSAHLARAGLPTHISDIPAALPDAAGLIGLMQQDKKMSAGRPIFILARGIGRAFICGDVPVDRLQAFLETKLKRP
ncbi:MAG: 3-dehydroquinate synthase [Hyphomicrobiales bacterium]|nr:3-dehydroquinate synthase [Hyphomicrobiales bacterium]